jgi:flagellin
MSTISVLTPFYNNRVEQAQAKIDTIQAQLTAGTKPLSAAQKETVAALSARAVKLSEVNTNITKAKSVIDVAAIALKEMAKLLQQMQNLANQANTPGMASTDYMTINLKFQKMLVDLGGYAVKASVNGTNLLSGTAILNVVTGTDGGPKSKTSIMPVNVMGLIRIGSLSGVSLESQQKSAITADAIRSALSFVNSGQAQLTSSTNNLLKIQNKATATIEQNKTTINTMQSIDVAGLKKQLAELKMQQSADYSVINQLNANAVNNLPALI